MSEEKAILNVTEAAEIAGCCERTLKQLLRDGLLPGTKLGKAWRVPREGLIKEMETIAAINLAQRREAEQKARAEVLALAVPRRISPPPQKRPSGPPPKLPPSIIKRKARA